MPEWDNESRRRAANFLARISNFEFCVVFTTIVKSPFYFQSPFSCTIENKIQYSKKNVCLFTRKYLCTIKSVCPISNGLPRCLAFNVKLGSRFCCNAFLSFSSYFFCIVQTVLSLSLGNSSLYLRKVLAVLYSVAYFPMESTQCIFLFVSFLLIHSLLQMIYSPVNEALFPNEKVVCLLTGQENRHRLSYLHHMCCFSTLHFFQII